MEINDLSYLKVLRDMTGILDVLAQNVQRLTLALHTNPNPAGETPPLSQPFPTPAVDRATIRVLCQRVQTMIDEMEKKQS